MTTSLSTVVIVGGHGQIALHLTRILSSAGTAVIGTIRNPAQAADIEAAGGTAAIVDLENDSAEDLAKVLNGADAVVFSAGAGPGSTAERKRTVDYGGAVLTADAAAIAGVSRLVQISAIRVEEPLPEGTEPVWAAYVIAKRDADHYVRDTSLDWTILRPGRLTNEPATGNVVLGEDLESAEITREDVAATVAHVLDDPSTIHKTLDVVNA
ncbi:SDR family oxidoreductase [Lysinibacter cavernae]|uniref:Uncharacterized protein YbjT (DUF2867 family) n=1 Tax=Lysinibacter cavernae TaxID=1640652 RepID=A0A7X5R087_9MICO|nr:SDR family oxidoreductase [Lysinibacter cavernae]NIH53188.1 uncharacterized protein YbjT (DUF2867 family) [Lysinibacter cavernae]